MIRLLFALLFCISRTAVAQVAPTAAETAAYKGLLPAAAKGDAAEIARLAASGASVNVSVAPWRSDP